MVIVAVGNSLQFTFTLFTLLAMHWVPWVQSSSGIHVLYLPSSMEIGLLPSRWVNSGLKKKKKKSK